MPLDPSISLGVKPVELPNPLTMALQGAALRNQMTQGNMLKQQMDANIGTSDAIKQATDPSTGNIDYNKAMTSMAGDPRAAYNLPQFAQSVNAMRQQQFDRGMKQLGWIKQNLASVATNPGTTPEDLVATIADGVKSGMLDPDHANSILNAPNFPKSPDQVRPYALQSLSGVMSAEQQMAAMTPGGGQIDTGPNTAIINTRPLAGQVGAPVAVYNKDLSPAEQTTPTQTGITPTGAPVMGTRQQFVDQANNGGVVTALSPYQQGAQSAAVNYKTDLDTRVRAAANSSHYLNEAQDVLQGVQTGGGTNFRMDLARRAQALGVPQDVVDKISGGNLGDQQVLSKVLLQNAIQQMQSSFTGTGTEKNVEQFLHNNPNLENDPRAIPKLMTFINGMNGNIGSEQQAFSKFVNGGGNPADFPAKWNASTTMRAFTGQIKPVATASTPDGRKFIKYSDGSVAPAL